MKRIIKPLYISKEFIKESKRYLEDGEIHKDAPHGMEVLLDIGGGYVADIHLCYQQDVSYVDPMLYYGDTLVAMTTPTDTLTGIYRFSVNDKEFVIQVVEEDTEPGEIPEISEVVREKGFIRQENFVNAERILHRKGNMDITKPLFETVLTHDFSDDLKVTLDVFVSEDGIPATHATLYDNGSDVGFILNEGKILGDYIFWHNNTKLVLSVELETI